MYLIYYVCINKHNCYSNYYVPDLLRYVLTSNNCYSNYYVPDLLRRVLVRLFFEGYRTLLNMKSTLLEGSKYPLYPS